MAQAPKDLIIDGVDVVSRLPFLGLDFCPLRMEAVVACLSQPPMDVSYGYVVTPNVDHLVRLDGPEAASIRRYYEGATLLLNDSAVLQRLAWLNGLNLPRCSGSDLSAYLLAHMVQPHEAITVIGGSAEAMVRLQTRYGLQHIHHHNPPMGFAEDPAAVRTCLDFILQHPSRFIFLAVGSPRQEMLAYALLDCPDAQGWALCIGASLDFLTGVERRAPAWMRTLGMEWLFRLIQDPRGKTRRYLWDGLKIFPIWWRSR